MDSRTAGQATEEMTPAGAGLGVLFVCLAPPLPASNGHRLRNLGLLKALSRAGHTVDIISFARSDERIDERLRDLCREVQFIPLPEHGSLVSEAWHRLRALPSPLPSGALRLRSPRMRTAVIETMQRNRYDAVLCDDVYLLGNVPARSPAPIFLNKHDITHEILGRFLRFERNPLKNSYARLERRKVQALEKHSCANAFLVLACSERDASKMKRLASGARFSILPNVIDVDAYRPASAESNNRVLYFGALDWYPNRDAVEFFANEILPPLRSLVPAVEFMVAGRGASEKFRSKFRGHSRLAIVSDVPDMAAETAKAAVCVVPLRIGSGTRLKILEAGAMEKAVVSTRIGAEGLELENGREIILADRPQEFAGAVATLLADPAKRLELGRNLRQRVCERYSVAALQNCVEQAFSDVCLRSRPV
jgi:polysaccharide biosynthesis protein PslH